MTQGYSDALLGIFDAIAPAASAALAELARRRRGRAFTRILAPTVPLSRHIFKAPTRFYKTGVVFLAYLNGLQDHFMMVGGQQSARSLLHLAELFRLADAAGVLRDPELAADRMSCVLAPAASALSVTLRMRRASRSISPPCAAVQSAQAVDACLAQGIPRIAPWRDQVAGDRA